MTLKCGLVGGTAPLDLYRCSAQADHCYAKLLLFVKHRGWYITNLNIFATELKVLAIGTWLRWIVEYVQMIYLTFYLIQESLQDLMIFPCWKAKCFQKEMIVYKCSQSAPSAIQIVIPLKEANWNMVIHIHTYIQQVFDTPFPKGSGRLQKWKNNKHIYIIKYKHQREQLIWEQMCLKCVLESIYRSTVP